MQYPTSTLWTSYYVDIHKYLFISHLPLQVSSVHSLIADGALGPALVTKRKVVQHAWPAEDVSAAGNAGCHRSIQADGARRHLMTVDAL